MSIKKDWLNKEYIYSSINGFLFLFASLVINYFTGLYANRQASNVVSDILLDNISVVNVKLLFVDGTTIFMLIVIALMFWKPRQIPFILKSMALFILIRSFSVSLTHIAPPIDRVVINKNDLFEKIFFDSDLFFSGHTGLPFLFALIYRSHKRLHFIFLAASLIGAVSVILGHLHYSIDVFAAFFITYTIYHLAMWLFKSDYQNFLESLSTMPWAKSVQ